MSKSTSNRVRISLGSNLNNSLIDRLSYTIWRNTIELPPVETTIYEGLVSFDVPHYIIDGGNDEYRYIVEIDHKGVETECTTLKPIDHPFSVAVKDSKRPFWYNTYTIHREEVNHDALRINSEPMPPRMRMTTISRISKMTIDGSLVTIKCSEVFVNPLKMDDSEGDIYLTYNPLYEIDIFCPENWSNDQCFEAMRMLTPHAFTE